MTNFVDLNAPDRDKGDIAYRRLYQSIIILTARDACESAQAAYDAYKWVCSIDGYHVFEWADLHRDCAIEFFKGLLDSDENKYNAKDALTYFRSANRGERSQKINQFIQQELFT